MTHRSGFDQVLAAVAAALLTISASTALAQSEPARDAASELAIDAAVPRPEPVDLPPPSIADIKVPETATINTEKPVSEAAITANVPVAEPAATPAVAETPAPVIAAPAPTAAPAVAAVASAPAIITADQAVADRLREALGVKTSKQLTRRGERAAVEKFYAARDYAPIWTQAGVATPLAKNVIARLAKADADGLDATDYPAPDFASAATPESLADAELTLTSSLLSFARQAQSGRMHFTQVGNDIEFAEHPTDPVEVLTRVSTATDVAAALDSYNPPQKEFRALKAKLAELRNEDSGPVVQISTGPALRIVRGKKNQPAPALMEDTRVPQIRAKLGITENPDDQRYDATVAAAVRKFQASANLKATGVLDDATVAALNSPKRDRHIDTVLVNMERWRWMPRELGASSIGGAYVKLNVPDYTLQLMQHDAKVWSTRVIVGKTGKHATPMMTETMKYITVNPTWNVPPSIITNEYLPALQQDPTVLERMGLRLERRADGTIHISQPPGDENALGRLRFNFPNKFLVYQHDTPNKKLFQNDERAYSHGCMRVQNPDQYAAALLSIAAPNERHTPESIRAMYGSKEITLNFKTPIPVHLTYETAFVDAAGKLQFRKDLYGRDARMLALLKNSKGKNLESVVAHAQPNYSRPRADIPQGVAFNDSSRQDSGMNFFERLFSPGTRASEPGRRIVR